MHSPKAASVGRDFDRPDFLRLAALLSSFITHSRFKARGLAIVTAALFSCLAAMGQSVEFPFNFVGPIGTSSFARGAFVYLPGSLTLNMTYQLSSPPHEINVVVDYGNGNGGLVFSFHYSYLPSLPAAGSVTRTRTATFINEAMLDAFQHGRVSMSISTDDHPYSGLGEIVGYVGVPTITCSGGGSINFGNPATVNAVVREPDGRAFVAVWSINGTVVQTIQVASNASPIVTNLSYVADLPAGMNLVNLAVTNSMNNGVLCSTLFTVVKLPWQVVTNAVATNSDLFSVTLTGNEPHQFFRLKREPGTAALQTPVLSIARSNAFVIITWPASATNFTLEGSSTLDPVFE